MIGSLLFVAAVIILVAALAHTGGYETGEEGFMGGDNSPVPAPFIPLECPTFPQYYNTICNQSPVRQNTCSPAYQPSIQPTMGSCYGQQPHRLPAGPHASPCGGQGCQSCATQGGYLAAQQGQPQQRLPCSSLVQPNCNSTQPVPSPIGCYPQTQFTQSLKPRGCAARCLLHRHYT